MEDFVLLLILILINYILIVDALKCEAIKQYNMYINKAIKGYKSDYQYILALISFINMPIQLEGMEFIK
nr:MAG TPA: hypothetical protein [Bacteriophage sp.]